jgi:hypothetical protein
MRQDWREATRQPITLDVVKLTKANGPQSVFEIVENALGKFGQRFREWPLAKLRVGHCFEEMAVVREGFGDAAEGEFHGSL